MIAGPHRLPSQPITLSFVVAFVAELPRPPPFSSIISTPAESTTRLGTRESVFPPDYPKSSNRMRVRRGIKTRFIYRFTASVNEIALLRSEGKRP
jgi:hypothetical protein